VPAFATAGRFNVHLRQLCLLEPTCATYFDRSTNNNHDKETAMTPRKNPANARRAAPETRRTDSVMDNHTTRVLIEAIRNSTTGKDQIVLRRLGLHDEPPKDLT
jgi:hypothetical protein